MDDKINILKEKLGEDGLDRLAGLSDKCFFIKKEDIKDILISILLSRKVFLWLTSLISFRLTSPVIQQLRQKNQKEVSGVLLL